MESDIVFCRICFGNRNQNDLIKPCQCTGTMAFVHLDCLLTWITYKRQNKYKCEICKSEFKMYMILRLMHKRNSSLRRRSYQTNQPNTQDQRPIIVNRNYRDRIIQRASASAWLNMKICLMIMITLMSISLFFKLVNLIKFQGSIDITIQKAWVPDMDILWYSKSDPYVMVCVDDDCSCKTQIKNNDNNPEWNHQCKYQWLNGQSILVNYFTSQITFLVFDADGFNGISYDGINPDDLIGGVSMPVYQMFQNGYFNNKNVVLKWAKPHPGSLMINMSWDTPLIRLTRSFLWSNL